MKSDGPNESGTAQAPEQGLGVLWLPLLLVAVVDLAGLARLDWELTGGLLQGPDSYMRLARVAELQHSGDWYQSVFPRSNAGLGESQHWTRPFDALLLALAAPLSLIAGFRGGLHLAGVLVGPLLHLAAVLALLWATAPLLHRQARFFMALMMLFQAGIIYQFLPGRADHHGFQALLFILLLGFALRLGADQLSRRQAGLAGGLAALAVWVSVEGLLGYGVLLAGLALNWIIAGGLSLRQNLFRMAAASALGLALALVAERPPEAWLAIEFDRPSIVHVFALSMVALFWGAVGRRPGGAL